MHGPDDISTNGLYDLSFSGLDLISIDVYPCDVRGLLKFSLTGIRRLSISVCPCYVRYLVDATSESGIPGLNGLGTESSLISLNGSNSLGP